MKPKVLVTGGSGYIGRWVLRDLSEDFDVIAPVRHSSEPATNVNTVLFEGLSPDTDWRSMLDGCSVVVHLAAIAHQKLSSQKQVQNLWEVNVDSTVALAREAALAGVKRFVFLSSIGVFGEQSNDLVLDETCEPNPHNEYARSKYQAEHQLRELCHDLGMELVVIRPPLVYGPGAPGNFGRLLGLVRSIPFNPFKSLNNKRSFVSVRNLSDLIRLVLNVKLPSREVTYCVTDLTLSTGELWNMVAAVEGQKVYGLPIPPYLFQILAKFPGFGKPLSQLTDNLCIDGSRVKTDLGWDPRFDFFDTFSGPRGF